MKKNCIGLIGCGAWGRYILRDLLALNAEVLVVARSEKTQKDAIELGAKGSYGSHQAIADKVDGFIVATPTSTHADILEEIIAYNKPIYVEKPVTSDVERAYSLLKKGKDKIFVMDKWRYHAGIDRIADYVKRSMLGNIELIKTTRVGWGNPHPDVDAAWILLPHDLSIVLHILGTLPPIHSVIPLLMKDPTAGAVITLRDDQITIILEFSVAEPIKRRGVYVVGSQASIELGGAYDEEVVLIEAQPAALNYQIRKIPVDQTMPLYLELKAFLDYLNYGGELKSTLQEGVLIVEMIHDIRQRLSKMANSISVA